MSVANHRWQFRPVRPGSMLIAPDNQHHAGTLGMILTDGVDPWLLTCRHVLLRANGQIVANDRILQGDGSVSPIATLVGVRSDPLLDCLAAKLLVAATSDVLGIGPVGPPALPQVGMHVRKSGWKTGVSEGVVVAVAGDDMTIDRMAGYPPEYQLALPGDSGAVWVDAATGSPVALQRQVGPGAAPPAFAVSLLTVLARLSLQAA